MLPGKWDNGNRNNAKVVSKCPVFLRSPRPFSLILKMDWRTARPLDTRTALVVALLTRLGGG